jgi:hypothetical protein
MRTLRGLVVLVTGASLIGGCAWYKVAPGVYVPGPAPVVQGPPPPVVAAPTTFDRSWAAARNAFLDQGVRVTGEERSTGTISGTKSGINLAAYVRTQADGSIRVEFRTVGATEVDPQLIERISESYERHMGR